MVRDQLAQETGVSLGSTFTPTRLVTFCQYKIMEVHKPKQPDNKARIHFCNWLVQNVHDGIMDQQLLILTNEALP